MKRHLRAFALLTMGTLPAACSLAADATGILNVSATISSDCAVGTSTLAFGTLSSGVVMAGNVDATGTVTVNCTNGVPYIIKLGIGTGAGARFSSRAMTAGTNLLDYTIYSTAAYTDFWGDGSGSSVTVAGTGIGTSQLISAYGRIFAGQTPQPGTYSDTVSVTVSY